MYLRENVGSSWLMEVTKSILKHINELLEVGNF